jgi:phenylalanine ammonia-lyase
MIEYRASKTFAPLFRTPAPEPSLILGDRELTIADLVRVARGGEQVRMTDDSSVLARIEQSRAYIADSVAAGAPIYGVTSGFGGMADVVIAPEDASELQNNAIWYHKTGAGRLLPRSDVRAAMLLRANSHMRGVSGLRLELIQRIITFLNADVTPHVHELGSIGASGDLVPLTYITGALIGLDESFKVDFQGEPLDSVAALERLGLPRLRLQPKEGLAMINGTSVMTGIAALCTYDAGRLVDVAMGAHALALQALRGTNQSFHPFIHAQKPHPGQQQSAARMLALLQGSQLSRDELDGRHDYRDRDLIQDRYSLRCLPQFMGPILDGLDEIERQVVVELNSANDNPLIDAVNQTSYHGGNFLGQYIGVTMDRLRYLLGLMAKHLDAQIALLVTPAFSGGLPGSLVGNSARRVNMGLKGLQLTANSIMPLLMFYGNSVADHFPTHAEQFNQNINSQGFNSANLARQVIAIGQQYLAIALMFGVQAVDLRTYALAGHYDARTLLSPATCTLYETVRELIQCPPRADRPYVRDDNEQTLDLHIARIAADLAGEGRIYQALATIS